MTPFHCTGGSAIDLQILVELALLEQIGAVAAAVLRLNLDKRLHADGLARPQRLGQQAPVLLRRQPGMELLVHVCEGVLSALVHQRADCLVWIARLVCKIVVVAHGALVFVLVEHGDHVLTLGQDAAAVLQLISNRGFIIQSLCAMIASRALLILGVCLDGRLVERVVANLLHARQSQAQVDSLLSR